MCLLLLPRNRATLVTLGKSPRIKKFLSALRQPLSRVLQVPLSDDGALRRTQSPMCPLSRAARAHGFPSTGRIIYRGQFFVRDDFVCSGDFFLVTHNLRLSYEYTLLMPANSSVAQRVFCLVSCLYAAHERALPRLIE